MTDPWPVISPTMKPSRLIHLSLVVHSSLRTDHSSP
jgi:hypothetical protein